MFVLGRFAGTGDIDYATYPLFHSKNIGDPVNHTFTEDPKLDELLDEGRPMIDEEERMEIYSEAQELLADIAPMIYTHYSERLFGVRNSVKDF